MIQAQLPDPSLAKDVGVIAWCFMVAFVGGIGALGYFLRRIVSAMDIMAKAQEATPAMVAKIEVLITERLGTIEEKLDESVHLAREHVRIAQMWEKTEAPGRSVRGGPAP